MAETTGISWCDRTWSPWIGCTKVSPACDGCYAAHLMDTRLGRVEWGPHGERQRTSESYWRQLAKWDREAKAAGRTISVFPSLCDPWDNAADPGIRREWFAVMRETPNLLHLLLSKRPQNAVAMADAAGGLPSNAALGATVEDQKRANLNVPHLLLAKKRLGARIAFLSCEPLLGPVDLTGISTMLFRGAEVLNGLTGELEGMFGDPCGARLPALDWVITGGETDQGPHRARPTNPQWFRDIRDACEEAGVSYHHKQNGEWVSVSEVEGPGRIHEFEDGRNVRRVGKRKSGRTIDGVAHNGMPEVRHG